MKVIRHCFQADRLVDVVQHACLKAPAKASASGPLYAIGVQF